MSLINQMLRDLDARHAPAVDRAALPGAVHALPRKRARSRPLLGLALVAAAAGIWVLLGQRSAPPPVAPPPPAPAVEAALIPPAPVLAVPAPAVAPAGEAPSVVPAASPPAVAESAGKRRNGTVGPAGVARPEAKEAGTKEARATDKAAAVAAPAAAPPVAEAPSDPASIDKRSRTSAAIDVAENEYRKAMAALRRGATTEAVDRLRAALRADNRHVSARQALLSLLVEQQQWSEAQAQIEEGLALDPAQSVWAMILARVQLENGKLAEAAETLARHGAHAEQNAEYQAFRALLLYKSKRPGEAAAHYRVALGLKPAESRWWYGLGLSLEADQKPKDARDAYAKARETGNLPPELATAVEQRLR